MQKIKLWSFITELGLLQRYLDSLNCTVYNLYNTTKTIN